MKTIKIGCASGFWGDSNMSTPQLLASKQLDYLVFDYLAEITMSIMARQYARNPDHGYAHDFVSKVMRDALPEIAAQGVTVIAPSDLEGAFMGQGLPVPRLDPKTAAERAANDFGATAVVLGRVTRWRERDGSAAGATRPASVAFEVSLHQAPLGRRLWTGRFDETQKSITEDIFRARKYPGGGTRWLTTGEFARWGAEEIAKSMTSAP